MNAFGRALSSVVETGKEILARRRLAAIQNEADATALADLCRQLLEHRGEASGLALASECATRYLALSEPEREEFFQSLLAEFDVDDESIFAATERYREDANPETLGAISKAVEAPRQKLFRRINMAPDGTRTLVIMRGHLLSALKKNPALRAVDSDLRHLFISWFNKGFLEMQCISWDTPASVLGKNHRVRGRARHQRLG